MNNVQVTGNTLVDDSGCEFGLWGYAVTLERASELAAEYCRQKSLPQGPREHWLEEQASPTRIFLASGAVVFWVVPIAPRSFKMFVNRKIFHSSKETP